MTNLAVTSGTESLTPGRVVVESPIASAEDPVTEINLLFQHLPTEVCSVNLFSLCISVPTSVMKFILTCSHAGVAMQV